MGVIQGADGNAFGQFDYYYFMTTEDHEPPYIVATRPADGATGVDEAMEYTIVFNNDDHIWVDREYGGEGYYSSGGEYVYADHAPPSDKKVTLTGWFNGKLVETLAISVNDEFYVDVFDKEIVLWPEYSLYSHARYCLSLDEGAVVDWSENRYLGSVYSHCFNTTNTIAPILEDITVEVMPGNLPIITMTFLSLGQTEPGPYLLSLVDTADGTTVQSIDPSDPSVATYHPLPRGEEIHEDGNYYEVTLKLKTALPGPATYALHYPAGAFKDVDQNGADGKRDNLFAFSVTESGGSCPLCTPEAEAAAPCNPDPATCTPRRKRRRARNLLFASVPGSNLCCA